MRYLGIDYGEKRIGLALSDPEAKIAFPHSTVANIPDILKVIKDEGAGEIVVGLPYSLDGSESKQAEVIRGFAAELKSAVELPIVFENELFTSKIAEATSSREHTDAAAAALILQSFLDRSNHES